MRVFLRKGLSGLAVWLSRLLSIHENNKVIRKIVRKKQEQFVDWVERKIKKPFFIERAAEVYKKLDFDVIYL